MTQHILDNVSLGALVIVRDKMMALQAAGRKVYRLEVGDTSFDPPAHIQKAIIDALQSGKTHYPPSTGLPALRQAALKKMREQNHLPIRDADHVVVARVREALEDRTTPYPVDVMDLTDADPEFGDRVRKAGIRWTVSESA